MLYWFLCFGPPKVEVLNLLWNYFTLCHCKCTIQQHHHFSQIVNFYFNLVTRKHDVLTTVFLRYVCIAPNIVTVLVSRLLLQSVHFGDMSKVYEQSTWHCVRSVLWMPVICTTNWIMTLLVRRRFAFFMMLIHLVRRYHNSNVG